MAHCIHIVLQVTFSIIGQNDAAQFAIASEVEASIGGEHQQTSHIPPTNLILGMKKETLKVKNGLLTSYILSIKAEQNGTHSLFIITACKDLPVNSKDS